ncbi:MAG: dihydropteroate synthase, partial [Clostridia bacterium]|nr:dihydropteroate synthase [Clostridia bacterium]
GKKRFKQALIENDIDYVLAEGVNQQDKGVHILDVNVGLPEIDEKEMMVKTVKALQAITDLPLQIDSSNPEVIEAALRIYNGKAIVNSVNGEDKSLHTVLPIVKKYGAAVVGLTLDEKGIPTLAEERVAIAEKIVNTALSYGIKREDIYIDCLTLTASAEQDKVEETLKAVEMVKEKFGVHTVLGVSNISFGLPNRELINKTFLALALGRGLDLPIINPNVQEMMNIINAFNVLSNNDKNAENYIGKYSVETVSEKPTATAETDITYAIEKGLADEAKQAAKKLLETEDAMTVINEKLIPALDKVGDNFEKGTIFLPQLIQSATAAQSAFDAVRMSFGTKSAQDKGTIVIATVKGDVHDIGKNIVKTILANYGYRIVDLGKNVDPKDVADAAIKEKAALVGLSALMTTTLGAMEETISLLREKTNCKIMVGGAVLTEDYAKAIGADYYAKDAKQGADIAKEVFGK